jgi:hypothetical protein
MEKNLMMLGMVQREIAFLKCGRKPMKNRHVGKVCYSRVF